MIEQPETPQMGSNMSPPQQEPLPQTPQLQGKLVLPAYDNWKDQTASKSIPAVRPEHLVRPTSTPSPRDPLAKLRYFWGKDPAYKVLFIAIGMVLVAAVVFASLVSAALLGNTGFSGQDGMYSQNAPPVVAPTGTLDLHPKFPTPGGGQGSDSSSQPPLQSTPALQNTPDSTPTPLSSPTPDQGGDLTIQITSIPSRVPNNSTVSVDVSASQPNVSVELYIIYNAAPFRSSAGPAVTDDNGNATITWYVSVFKFRNARANVTAIARNGDGQRVESQTVTVQVAGFSQ